MGSKIGDDRLCIHDNRSTDSNVQPLADLHNRSTASLRLCIIGALKFITVYVKSLQPLARHGT
jgi:hypothetical protein